jgi:hypothetical protein
VALEFSRGMERGIQPWRKRGDVGGRSPARQHFPLHYHQRQQQPVPVARANLTKARLAKERRKLIGGVPARIVNLVIVSGQEPAVGRHIDDELATGTQYAVQLGQCRFRFDRAMT